MPSKFLSVIKKHKIIFSVLPIIILTVLILNYLIIPLSLKVGALHWIKNQEQIKSAHLGEVSFNLFNGVTKIKNISYTNQEGIATKLDHFHLNLDAWPYWKKKVKIRDIQVQGVTLNVSLDEKKQVSIGGIILKPQKKQKTASPDAKRNLIVELIGPISLNNNSIKYSTEGVELLVKEEQLTIGGSLAYDPQQPKPISGKLNLELKNTFSSIDKGNFIKIGELNIEEINLHKDPKYNIKIKKISLSELQVSLLKNSMGETIAHQLKRITPPSSKKKKKSKETLSIYIGDINVDSNSTLGFVDYSLKPKSKLKMDKLSIKLGTIDSKNKNKDTPVHLSAKLSKYSSIKLEGNIRPFSMENLFDIKGRIKSFNLLNVSPYSAKYIDHAIQRGHLSSRIKGKLKKNKLDVKTSTRISKLAITSTQKKKKKNSFTQMFGLPMTTAISLLSDKEENINIDIPVKGNIKDPEFQIIETVQSAIAGALKNNAFGYLAPLGIQLVTGVALPPGTLFLTELAFKQASTISFKPLEFAPLENKLTPGTKTYLKEVGKMVRSRPKIRLLICPQANKSDISQIAPSLKELTDKQKKELLDIATRRGQIVMDFLVEQGKMKPEQLFLCASEIKEKAMTPNVALYM